LASLLSQLRATCPLPLPVVGVGNPMRADDGFGPAVVAELPPRDGLALFDAGVAPENWLGPIARAEPRCILVLDAADLGEAPGALRLLAAGAVESIGVSTHGLPLGFFLQMAAERCGAPAFLLAVQPACLDMYGEMTEPVRDAARQAVEALASLTRPTSSHEV